MEIKNILPIISNPAIVQINPAILQIINLQ